MICLVVDAFATFSTLILFFMFIAHLRLHVYSALQLHACSLHCTICSTGMGDVFRLELNDIRRGRNIHKGTQEGV